MKKTIKNIDGYTLIEILVALIVSSVLVMAAAPSFQRLREGGLVTSMSNDLLADILWTRSEAVKLNSRVTLCHSSDAATCSGADWSAGWILFQDADNSGTFSGGDTLIGAREAPGNGLQIAGGTQVANYISYVPTGRSRDIAGNLLAGDATSLFTIKKGIHENQISITPTGKPRVESIAP